MNSMSWQEYVDSGLVGSGKISVAALIGQDQSIWAKSSNFPAVTSQQIASILKGFSDPSGLRAEGIRLGEDKVSSGKMNLMQFFSSSLSVPMIEAFTVRRAHQASCASKPSRSSLWPFMMIRRNQERHQRWLKELPII